MNVIEQLWRRIKKNVDDKNPKSLPEARKFLKREWKKIKRRDLKKLFDSLPDRVNEVIENDGDKTHYWTTTQKGE